MKNPFFYPLHALILTFAAVLPARLSAQELDREYCYGSQCFPTLDQAEAEMRSQSPYGELLRRERSDPESSVYIRFHYGVPNQDALRFFDPVYFSPSAWEQSDCVNDNPIYRNGCSSEAMAAAEMWKARKDTIAPSNCSTSSSYQLKGRYFPRIYSVSPNGNTLYGQIRFANSNLIFGADSDEEIVSRWDDPRRAQWDLVCPSPYQPKLQFATIDMYVIFTCPQNFQPDRNAAIPQDGDIRRVKWCSPSLPLPTIYGRLKQVRTCPANANPCHPATGDKSRSEDDFRFAGRTFTRHYHSLKEQADRGMGIGWTHSFSPRVYKWGSEIRYVSADGYFSGTELISGNMYRVSNEPGTRVYDLGGGPTPYRLIQTTGETWDFNADGLPVTLKNPLHPANDIRFFYLHDQLKQMQDATGRTLEFRSEQNLISRIDLPDGTWITYEYDSDRNLTSARFVDGSTKSYFYTENGLAPNFLKNHLTGIAYEDNQRYASFSYDDYGRVIYSGLHANSKMVSETTLSYSSDGKTIVQSPQGLARTYSVQPGIYRRITKISETYGESTTEFDASGRAVGKRELSGLYTRYSYPDAQKTIRTQEIGGKVVRSFTTLRSASFNTPIKEEIRDGSDSLVSIRTWSLNDRGQVLVERENDPRTGAERTHTYRYCESTDVAAGNCPIIGLLVSVDGPRTDVLDVTELTYRMTDAAECQTAPSACGYRRGDLWKITRPQNLVTEFIKYDGAGRPLVTKSPSNSISLQNYTARGWPSTTFVQGMIPDANDGTPVLSIKYWPTGKLQRIERSGSPTLNLTYDSAQRLIAIEDAEGNHIAYEVDASGNNTSVRYVDSSGKVTREIIQEFDQHDRMVATSEGGESPTLFRYDAAGNRVQTITPSGVITKDIYDEFGNIVQKIRDPSGINASTRYIYDTLGRIEKVIDPKGLITTYTRNSLGDLLKITSPDSGTTTFTVDPAGNVVSQRDARGDELHSQYDSTNRISKVISSDPDFSFSFYYDEDPKHCGANSYNTDRGASSIKSQSGRSETHYCYDRFGNVVKRSEAISGTQLTTTWKFSNPGTASEITYPDGSLISLSHDKNSSITEIAVTHGGNPKQTLLTQVKRLPFGPASEWVYGNGRRMRRDYDLAYRPIHSGISGDASSQLTLNYDRDGNISHLVPPTGSQQPPIRLTYDAIGRLTSFRDLATDYAIESYTYDETGNRASTLNSSGPIPYQYAKDSHHLISIGSNDRKYDASGNLISDDIGNSFTYGASGRVSQSRNANGATEIYHYNSRGERVHSQNSAGDTLTLFDEKGKWLGDYQPDSKMKQQSIWLEHIPVGLLAMNKSGESTLLYLEPDSQGTPRAVFDPEMGKTIWNWSSFGESFGTTPPNEDPDEDGSSFTLNMRFPGQQFDPTSGLNYNYFREYEARTGRYTQSDPIGLSGGINTYAYAESSPFMFSDPLGLTKWSGIGLNSSAFVFALDDYHLSANCPSGGTAYSHAVALLGTRSIKGGDLSITATKSAQFEDANESPDPSIFNGKYIRYTLLSFALGRGHAFGQAARMGGAWTDIGVEAESYSWQGSQWGLDRSFSSVAIGQAFVISKRECVRCEADPD
ncbi:TPA: RHS repeat-associated core domain-containing protein [Stenotrophomonas maltophilia]|nr:RHS repeat-associated core domain-containing protein [Stenotrophomonas maltophilia]HDS1024770.1 RHS repeat-associated core domain-containing protein [Stenotrophomonas maltophilia]HDS1029419.1 RHS repeat-associated core domain-containing protein [Stenotrophomonas maltophilia]HDS1033654.1 RHS repeat-associated core domain-containing protein [Stenotrophomonas maltophilia]